MNSICQLCGKKFKVDFNVSDNLWKKIADGRNLLCSVCIAEKLEKLGYGAFKLVNLA